jgi:hypothetical protein
VGVYSGDTGQTLNLELHRPLIAAGADIHGLGATGFFFADHGWVKPYRAPASTLKPYEALTGVGWGMNVAWGKSACARVTVGYGATGATNQPRNYEITLQFVASVF